MMKKKPHKLTLTHTHTTFNISFSNNNKFVDSNSIRFLLSFSQPSNYYIFFTPNSSKINSSAYRSTLICVHCHENENCIGDWLTKMMNCPKYNRMLYRPRYANGWHRHSHDNWLQRESERKKSRNSEPLPMPYVLAFSSIEFIDVYQARQCFNIRRRWQKC